jgi:hypothetical protein
VFESQVKSKFAWLQSREELKESDQSKCVNQPQPITGGPQSVQFHGMANEPSSAWRRLKVSMPDTVRIFRTTNR